MYSSSYTLSFWKSDKYHPNKVDANSCKHAFHEMYFMALIFSLIIKFKNKYVPLLLTHQILEKT